MEPTGGMVVLAATNRHPRTGGIRDFLAEQRRASTAAVRARPERGQAEGDVPPGADTGALAGYVSSVQCGMSRQAGDGAGRDDLLAVVDLAMAGREGALRPLA